jgi:flagellar biosynthetic protein FlhB
MADNSHKTEKPTPRRLREARERGQIARSPDLSAWAAMLAATVLIQSTVTRGSAAFTSILHEMGEAAGDPDERIAMRFAAHAAWEAVAAAAPLLIGLTVLAVVVGVAQVGTAPNVKRLKPDFSRLNLFKGMKRLVSASSWWEVAKSVAKVGVLVAVAWPAVAGAAHAFTTERADSLEELVGLTGSTALTILRNVSVAGLVIGVVDYLWQRRRLTKQLMMSRQEVQEELKQQEGNPEVRRAIRSRQAAISRNRMISMVGGADVVVVNPTHYAVALRYRPERGAPEVVAKGAGAIAARIRAEAARHDVPVVHEPALTRALFRACAVGDVIPVALYEAVAHLLAFVFGLRARGRAHGYHDLPRPVPVPA